MPSNEVTSRARSTPTPLQSGRRRSIGVLGLGVLALPSVLALGRLGLGDAPLPASAELGVGIFFVAAVTGAVVAGLWVESETSPHPSTRHAARVRPLTRDREEGWIQRPVPPAAHSSEPARDPRVRVHERRPPAS